MGLSTSNTESKRSRNSSARGGVARAELAGVHGAVGVAHVLEDGGQGFGGVQIVVQAVGKCLRSLRGAGHQRLVDAFGVLVGFQPQLEIAQPVDGGGGRFQPVEGEVERLAVGHRSQQVADGFRLVAARQQVAQGVVVAQRLGHLLALHHEELGVQPEAREGFAGERFRLRNLVFVVREDQIDAAGVNIQRLAQVLDGHHGALDVPAGAAGADGGLPERLAFLGRLPQREIAGVGLFVFVHVHARAGQVAAEIVVRELAVSGKGGNPEVDRTVAGVGVVPGAQALDGRHHVVDVLGGGDQALGALQPQRGAVLQERLGIDAGVFRQRLVLGHGIADDLVVHVGDVHDVVEAESAGAQPFAQDVEEGEGAEVADMGVIVDRGAAGIHADGVVARRRELLHPL